MSEGRWKLRCGDLDHSGHDWYGVLDRMLQSYPELVPDFESCQEYECYLNWKLQNALDVYNTSIDRQEPEQSAHEFAMEELLSMAISKNTEDNPDPPHKTLESAQADMAADMSAYLDFLYGDKWKDKRPKRNNL